MNQPLNKELYEKVRRNADAIYSKPSAYKSGYIVRAYKDLGGKYSGDKTKEGISRWFHEKWVDVGNKDYKVYRPTKRINKLTPLTINEIDPKNIEENGEYQG
jgi:hypothetical protein